LEAAGLYPFDHQPCLQEEEVEEEGDLLQMALEGVMTLWIRQKEAEVVVEGAWLWRVLLERHLLMSWLVWGQWGEGVWVEIRSVNVQRGTLEPLIEEEEDGSWDHSAQFVSMGSHAPQ
jgi:hypothetical protein